ncbi:hypothetical protein ColKHC_11106 [Colletotrichum higginsianum]|nr:hypothetical protein ColKHC_11106 [Colletotrichum higginsianum]
MNIRGRGVWGHDSRDADAPLARLAAVELHPRVVSRMVAHGEAVHGRPQAPAGPLADVRVRRPRDDEDDEVARVGADDGEAAPVGLVADVGEEEDDDQRQRGADGGEGVGLDAVEAEVPCAFVGRQCFLFPPSWTDLREGELGFSYMMMVGVYVVRGLHVEKTAKLLRKWGQRCQCRMVFHTRLGGMCIPWAPPRRSLSSSSRRLCRISRSGPRKRTMPGLSSGSGVSGEPGRRKRSDRPTKIVKTPSTFEVLALPSIMRAARKPLRSTRKTCMVATKPKSMTCPEMYLRGPTWGDKHIGRDLEDDNPQKHELVAQVDGVLVDANVRREAAGEGAREVHAVQLEDEEAEIQQREHRAVDPGGER